MVRIAALLPLAALASEPDESALLSLKKTVKHRTGISPFTGACPPGYVGKTGKPGGQPLNGGMNGYIDRDTAFADCEADANCCAVSETDHPGNAANKDTGDKFRLGICNDWEDHVKWNSCVVDTTEPEPVVAEIDVTLDSYIKIDAISEGLAAEATCEELGHRTIEDPQECAAAAAALGLSPKSGGVIEVHNRIDRPAGCTWHSGATNLEFWHEGFTGCGPYNYNCLCVKGNSDASPEPPVEGLPPAIQTLENECEGNTDDEGEITDIGPELCEGNTGAQEELDAATCTGKRAARKAARKARRAFNKAYFFAKRDCSEDTELPADLTAPAPCECKMQLVDPTDGVTKLKRREKFAHCDHSLRSKACKDCEKSQFLHHLGVVEKAMDVVAQSTICAQDDFSKAILSGDIKELRDAGFRVHPQQAMRWLNQCWENAKCQCADVTQECVDGVLVNKETGAPEKLSKDNRDNCKTAAMEQCIQELKHATFSEKKPCDLTVAEVEAEYVCGTERSYESEVFSAYWEYGNCGHFGNDYGKDVCGGIRAGACPTEITPAAGATYIDFTPQAVEFKCKKAVLKWMKKSDAFLNDRIWVNSEWNIAESITLEKCDTDCHYLWHAQYECVDRD